MTACQLARERHAVRAKKPNHVSRGVRGQDDAGAVRREAGVGLERDVGRGIAVIEQRVQQRMAQSGQRRAAVAPLELPTRAGPRVETNADRARRRQVEPVAAIADETVSQQSQHRWCRDGCKRPAPDAARRFTRKSGGSAAGCRRNFVYNFSAMVRFLTAGESHGRALVVILEGIPAGLPIDVDAIAADLRRRQGGYGRGRRMAIESDRAEILSGVRGGETIGGPIAMLIENRDWPNWQQTMHPAAEVPAEARGANRAPVTRPRPGHADLAGVAKYGRADLRDVLERASARETASRVAAGAIARQLLARAGDRLTSHVFAIGAARLPEGTAVAFERAAALPADAPLRCVDPDVERRMIEEIDQARETGDTLGGAFEVIATGVPIGLGSYVQWDRKLDGRLAQALMSIPAIKAVGIGLGPEAASRPGSRVHDEIVPADADARASARTADQQRRRARGRRHQRRGSPRVRLDEADLDADEAAALRRSRDDDRVGGGDRAQRRLRRARPPRSSARRWSRSCSPTRWSRSSAATRSRSSSARWPHGRPPMAGRFRTPAPR